ncbi:MAG: hypothetical protein Q7Q71_13725 [Verrucomicrobiota bacterium JB023]|nr:hypothetical protein [Verrucomicrobiota bacterium JB023]
MRAVLLFLLLLAFGSPGGAQTLDTSSPPDDGIWDPERFLDEDYRHDIAARIDNEKVTKDFELFVVLFPHEPMAGSEVVAREAGANWATSGYWAVIYQVGAEGMPECAIGGELIELLRPDAELVIRNAKTMAWLVGTRQERLDEMVNEVATGLGFLKSRAELLAIQAGVEARKEREARKEARTRALVYLIVFSFLGLLALLGLIILFKRWREGAGPLEFPRSVPRKRLLGPHSGGGNVQVSFGEER